jgi:hypothetical protein
MQYAQSATGVYGIAKRTETERETETGTGAGTGVERDHPPRGG